MNYKNLAQTILHLVGNNENINSVSHCATRLRFTLKENSRANKEELLQLDGVLSVVESGGQYQIIIGDYVSHVYSALLSLMSENITATETNDVKDTNQTSVLAKIFDIVAGSFSPLIGALAGSGMIKALLAVLTMTELLDPKSTTYAILSATANSVFYFLPILLGISIAIKIKANAYIGGAIGAALLEPNFTSLIGNSHATFLDIPVVAINYSSSVFPIFIAVTLLYFLEKSLKKICPNNIQMFMVPMICLLITVPMTVLVFGPFGVNLGNLIASGISWLIAHSGILTGLVIGGSAMFLVIFGLHWGLVPVIIANLNAGGDPIAAMWAACTFAQMGVAAGLWLRTRDTGIKSLSGPAVLSGLLAGVTEPIIYGLIMRYRKTIPVVIISGAVGGAIIGYFKVKISTFAFHSLLTIPVFKPTFQYVIGIGVSFTLALVLSAIICKPDSIK